MLWGRGLVGLSQHGTSGIGAVIISVCCKEVGVWLQEKIQRCGRCRLLLRCLWQRAQITCKLWLVCTDVFFSFPVNRCLWVIKRYLGRKSHELMWRKVATLFLGRRITLSKAVVSPEIPQHRIRLGWLPAKVASKIICDFCIKSTVLGGISCVLQRQTPKAESLAGHNSFQNLELWIGLRRGARVW